MKSGFAVVAGLSLFVNLLMLVPALYMLQLYDRVLVSRSVETLLVLTGILVFMFIFLTLMDWIRHRVVTRLANRFEQELRHHLFHAMYDWILAEPDRASSLPVRDLFQIRQFIASPGFTALFDAPWIPVYIFVLFLFHDLYGWFAVMTLIVMSFLLLLTEKFSREPGQKAQGLQNQSQQQTDFNVRNFEVVEGMGMRTALYQQWDAIQTGWQMEQTKANDQHANGSVLAKYLRLLFQSLILGLGGYLVINMELTPGMMIAGSIVLGRALAPLDLLTGQWKNMVSARAAYHRLNQLLSSFPQKQASMPLPEPEGRIQIENLIYIPAGMEKPILSGVNLQLNQGQLLGIIGPSASGKTSLVRVLLGVSKGYRGKVEMDGAELSLWNREELGQYVGYLPQDIELFKGSVKDNIARFQQLEPDAVIAAAQLADAHEMILGLPQGYDTVIGESNTVLSAGQRQRIALARAVLGNPKLVILDEPNANLDDAGERALANTLIRLKSSGTVVIMISHRVPVLRVMDQIAVMNEGRIDKVMLAAEFFQAMQKR